MTCLALLALESVTPDEDPNLGAFVVQETDRAVGNFSPRKVL